MTRVPALLVMHADLAAALLRAAETLYGPVEDVVVLSNEGLSRDVILHGSPATVIDKIEHLRSIGVNSLMLHYPPWYGADRAIASLERFSAEVMPAFAGGADIGRKAEAPARVARI